MGCKAAITLNCVEKIVLVSLKDCERDINAPTIPQLMSPNAVRVGHIITVPAANKNIIVKIRLQNEST